MENTIDLKKESQKLLLCPFCKGNAEFQACKNDKAPICLHHHPKSGVCIAQCDQYCETIELGLRWWNRRD